MGIEEVEKSLEQMEGTFPQETIDLLRGIATKALESAETIKALRELLGLKDQLIVELRARI